MDTERIIKEIVLAKQEPKNMSTDELEKYIEERYTTKAPQNELDKLETEYARRVIEDDLNMT